MFEKIEPGVKALAFDVDNTLVNLRDGLYGSILDADLLIPILRFASLLKLPLAIDTARDKRLDDDISANGAVSVSDLLHFMKKRKIFFCIDKPSLIVKSEDVKEFRAAFMSQYTPIDKEWDLYIREKNPDLHMILQRINEFRSSGEKLKPEDLLIVDDSEVIVTLARKAGFKAILVPLDFSPGARGTSSVDYLYELAKLIGLAAYAEGLEQDSKKYDSEPEEAVAIAKQYLEAKKNRSQGIRPETCLVHQDLQNLVELVGQNPKSAYRVLKKFKGRSGYNRMIDEQRVVGNSTLVGTMLGVAILKNNYLILHNLLKLGASSEQPFDFDSNYRTVSPLVAAILNNCDSDILQALLQTRAKIDSGNLKESILELALSQFCRTKNLDLESYKRLDVLVFHMQRRLGIDAYLANLCPLFSQIIQQKDPALLNIFLMNLMTEHKQALLSLVADAREFKGLILNAPKADDAFNKQFLLDFFFQIPLQNMKTIIEFPFKTKSLSASKDRAKESAREIFCRLVYSSFLVEGEQKFTLIKLKRKGSGLFFKSKSESSKESDCQEKVEQLVMFALYIEKYYGATDTAESLMLNTMYSSAILIVNLINESGYCKHLSSTQKATFKDLSVFLTKQGQEPALQQSPKKASAQAGQSKAKLFSPGLVKIMEEEGPAPTGEFAYTGSS
ncbi:hypothetical protein BN59_02310 [Legionella massiliensis]|uniref:Uncharacterized protein n=1 Tax=Legionella massiliensis TaxID=1034943 RepID=A0A078L1W4_9GAMM|nr:hypothetical protein [Legionella massiliensis]CDZ78013.1 hypothetical protein BN59_02310 [Legionella massiliensis]CEE13751.1 hypothetical protein BN1094_02310 [Legionella massiliensis]